jgi:hypothetical protein
VPWNGFENLALSCGRCNQNKSGKTAARDWYSGKVVELYNPRIHVHSEHFSKRGPRLVGKTPIGRATSTLLFRYTEKDTPGDSTYPLASEIDDEEIARKLHIAHGCLLGNRFDECAIRLRTIDESLQQLPGETRNNPSIQFAQTFMAVRICTLRALSAHEIGLGADDLRRAQRLLQQAFKSRSLADHHKAELVRLKSTLHQQRAAVWALAGDSRAHAEYRATWAAHKHYMQHTPSFEAHIRGAALQAKCAPRNKERQYSTEQVANTFAETDRGSMSALCSLIDIELAGTRPNRSAEALLEKLDGKLQVCGYGDNRDYCTTVLLRRRWWLLKAWIHDPLDFDLLAVELEWWQEIKLYNEVRQMLLGIDLPVDVLRKRC